MVACIRLNLFVKIDLQKWLNEPFESPPIKKKRCKTGDSFPRNGKISRKYPNLATLIYLC